MSSYKKYTREQVIEAIREKFGSIEKYAELKKTSKQNISQKAIYQSKPFMKELREDGIDISGTITQEYKERNSSQQESDMHGNFIGTAKEINHHYNSVIASELIKELTEPYKTTIEVLKERIEEKNKKISELEEKLLHKKQS